MWLLLACDVESVAIPYPRMVPSTTELDFGEVAEGSEATATFTVRNDGYLLHEGAYLGFDMGLQLESGGGSTVFGPGAAAFCVSWDEAEITCDGPTRQPKADRGHYSDSGPAHPVDTSVEPPVDTGDPGRCPAGTGQVRLGPGCSIPVRLAFAPTGAGEHEAELVLESVGAGGGGGVPPTYAADQRNFRQLVYLRGRAPGVAASAATTVGIVDAMPDGCERGERVEFRGRLYGTAAPSPQVQSEARCTGGTVEGTALSFQCACPRLRRCNSASYEQFFLFSADGRDPLWSVATGTAHGEGIDLDADYVAEAHEACAPRDGAEGTCGLGLGLGLLAWRRHRRGPGADKRAR